MNRILLVDDEESIREVLSIFLKKLGFDVEVVENSQKAIEKIRGDIYDIIITDLVLEEEKSGLEIVKSVKEYLPFSEVIVITGFGTIESAVEAMKLGAFHYITKPINTEELKIILNKAFEKISIYKELNREVKKEGEIIYKSKEMGEILKLAYKAAEVDSPVLITGETGVGKELIAKFIHKNSKRKNFPFVAISCAAIPENLLESELFGYVKGAFTDAKINKRGLLEEANRGTFLFDEIGDAPLTIQTKFLRFLEESEIRRLGDTKNIKLDVRVISATNKNLKEEIEKGNFREDLYYRLNVINIYIPPLRNRREDIIELSNYFLKKYSEKYNKKKIYFSEKTKEFLYNYDFPGNVRELENIIERAVIISEKEEILPKDLPFYSEEDFSVSSTNLREVEKNTIKEVLKKHKGNLSAASKELGIGRTTLWRKIKEYNIPI
jgi:DNA-binding NtrC family response regulator